MNLLILDPIKLINNDAGTIHRIELIRNFCLLRHNVYVLAREKTENGFKDLLDDPFIHLKYIGQSKSRFFLYLYNLMSFLIKEKINILYTRNMIYCGLGIFFKKINKSILIFEKNGIISDEANLSNYSSNSNRVNILIYGAILYFKFLESLELFFLKYCDAVVAVTPLIKQYLIENGINGNKIHVIENGANTDMFKPMSKSDAQNEVGLDQEQQYVCFVGNLVPWQGLEYLVNAAPFVLEKINVKFLVVGDGIMREQLVKMVNDLDLDKNFIFVGAIPYENVPKYINASDVCVAPFIRARNEKIGLSPLKIYEYLACGKAVIASDITGVSDLLQNSGGGIVVTPEHSGELAKSIVHLLQNDELSVKMGINGRNYVVENNSWASIAKKTVVISEQLIKEKER